MLEKTFETSVVSFLSRLPMLFRSRAESMEEFNLAGLHMRAVL